MNPPFSKTQQITVEFVNGCLQDEIVNTGNFNDGNKRIMDYTVDPAATSLVYYINEGMTI